MSHPCAGGNSGLVALVAVVGTVLCPVATSSGEALERRVGDPGAHAELGDHWSGSLRPWRCWPWSCGGCSVALGDPRSRGGRGPRTGCTVPTGAVSRPVRGLGVVAVLAVVASVGVGVQVYRVGDSGAKAVWADQMTAAPGGDATSD